ncbi:MAG TPA: HAD-IA family hydrolase [Acidimicrobiales bacterium]|nr:HAD-IA family hydrolase [Acidimicrobiales bacterium]
MTEELEDAPAALRPRQGRIRAVLFDFGGVLTTSPFEAFARYEREHGLPPGFIRSLNAQNHHDNAWARLERNEVSIPQFVELFEAESAGAGHVVDGASVLALLGGELRPRMVRAVERCRRHYLVGLLTNNFLSGEAESHPGGGTASVLSLFHEVVESSKVGVRKPEARFFEIACERLGIEAAEAVFLDDLGVNLKPARAMGMTTIKVVSEDQALSELEKVVGLRLR